jgi:tRNA pseudouridine55 synthase
VRSLVHDVGQELGCGAALASLRRTWVGKHAVDGAQPLDAFQSPDDVRAHLVPMDEALQLPEVVVTDSGHAILGCGGMLARANLRADCPVSEGWVQVKNEQGRLLALGVAVPSAGGVRIQPKRVFV